MVNGTPLVSEVSVILAPTAFAVTGTAAGLLLLINVAKPCAIRLLLSATPELKAEPLTKYSN